MAHEEDSLRRRRPPGRGLLGVTPAAAQTITLKGASQFDDNHSFNQTMLKFAELVQKYYGKPVNFVLHRNRELGLEKDYFAYMSQGLSVDYADRRPVPHGDLLQAGHAHGHALPVPRPGPLAAR